MELVGTVQSKTKGGLRSKQFPLEEYDLRQEKVIIRITNHVKLQKGESLYIVEKNQDHDRFRNGMIIGKVQVLSFYDGLLQGPSLIGKGILAKAKVGHFAVRPLREHKTRTAWFFKNQGDFHLSDGNLEHALRSFLQSLKENPEFPEAHSSLGSLRIILSQKRANSNTKPALSPLPVEAIASYTQAWKYRSKFRYSYEKLHFLQNYMETFFTAWEIRSREASREERPVSYLERIIQAGEEALQIDPKHHITLSSLAQTHYEMMKYYSRSSSPKERKIHDHSQKQADKYLKSLLSSEGKNPSVFHTAILFYFYRYMELRDDIPDDIKLRSQIREMILKQIYPYYHLYLDKRKTTPDPRVERIAKLLSSN